MFNLECVLLAARLLLWLLLLQHQDHSAINAQTCRDRIKVGTERYALLKEIRLDAKVRLAVSVSQQRGPSATRKKNMPVFVHISTPMCSLLQVYVELRCFA